MSEFVPFPPPEPVEGLYVVGFRLDPSSDEPQFYTLVALEGENERPLLVNGRIVFFSELSKAAKAASRGDSDFKRLGPPKEDVEMMCDVAQALHVANSQDADGDGLLMDVIACFDDLVRATQVNVPAEYMGVLSAVAARLGETPEFGTWLGEQGIDRERLEDALLWCIGAVAAKSSWM
jgi:hypothetical protein